MGAPRGHHRLSAGTLAIGAALVVLVIGALAVLVTWAFRPSPGTACTLGCPGAVAGSAGALLREAHAFKSSEFGYTIQEPAANWSLQSHDAAGASFETSYGWLQVAGIRGDVDPATLIGQEIERYKRSPQFPDLEDFGPVRGAHIGTVDATGEVFKGSDIPQSGGGESAIVGVVIVVAQHDGFTVSATALIGWNPGKQRWTALNPGAVDIDSAFDEFLWPGQG